LAKFYRLLLDSSASTRRNEQSCCVVVKTPSPNKSSNGTPYVENSIDNSSIPLVDHLRLGPHFGQVRKPPPWLLDLPRQSSLRVDVVPLDILLKRLVAVRGALRWSSAMAITNRARCQLRPMTLASLLRPCRLLALMSSAPATLMKTRSVTLFEIFWRRPLHRDPTRLRSCISPESDCSSRGTTFSCRWTPISRATPTWR